MKKRVFCGFLLCIALVFCLSVTPSATAASAEEEVLQLIADYFKGWNTSDYELMASIHWNSPEMSFFASSKDTSFLTTGWEQTAERFKSAFEQPVGTYSWSCHDPKVVMLENNVAVVTMYALLTVNTPNTDEQQISQIRGTQVISKIKGKWQIVHVHWSILPTE